MTSTSVHSYLPFYFAKLDSEEDRLKENILSEKIEEWQYSADFLNKPFFDGTLPLFFALRTDKKEAIKEMIARGADPFLEDSRGQSAVEYAVYMQKEDYLPILLPSFKELPANKSRLFAWDVAKNVEYFSATKEELSTVKGGIERAWEVLLGGKTIDSVDLNKTVRITTILDHTFNPWSPGYRLEEISAAMAKPEELQILRERGLFFGTKALRFAAIYGRFDNFHKLISMGTRVKPEDLEFLIQSIRINDPLQLWNINKVYNVGVFSVLHITAAVVASRLFADLFASGIEKGYKFFRAEEETYTSLNVKKIALSTFSVFFYFSTIACASKILLNKLPKLKVIKSLIPYRPYDACRKVAGLAIMYLVPTAYAYLIYKSFVTNFK